MRYRGRLLLGLAVLLMMVPTFLMMAGPLNRPMLVDGDRLEQRPCPTCKGVDPKCRRCHGRGVVPFILPGPQRPTYLVGHLYGPDEHPVEGAAVAIQTSAGNISLHTDPLGRFGATLPPGTYPLTMEGPGGKGKLSQDLKVEVLTEPVPADEEMHFHQDDREFRL